MGKEANKLEQVEAGIITDQEEVYTVYEEPWEDVRVALERMPVKELGRQTGLSPWGVYKLRYGLHRPRPEHRVLLQAAAVAWVRGQLGTWDIGATDRDLLARYRQRLESAAGNGTVGGTVAPGHR
ncbi:MAG: hypothetical protein M1296_06570 [Chloroflexi bacterium]|nr:hypothetical protein [Chloroflexota bacterium]